MRVPKRVVVTALAVFALVICLQPKAATAQDSCPVCPTNCCGEPVYDPDTGQCVCPASPLSCPCGTAACVASGWVSGWQCPPPNCPPLDQAVCSNNNWVCESPPGGGGCDPSDCTCNPNCGLCDICDPACDPLYGNYVSAGVCGTL